MIKNNKIFILFSILFLLHGCLNKNTTYDYNITIKIDDTDINVLKERLKQLKIIDYKINSINDNYKIEFAKKSLFKQKVDINNFPDILFSNHFYEIYFVDQNFNEELEGYLTSDDYHIDFSHVLDKPILSGIYIEKIKIISDQERSIIEIRYNYLGEDIIKEAIKINSDKMMLIFLDKMFWTYSQGILSKYEDLSVSLNPSKYIIERFQKSGKNYNDDDIRIITLFSKYNYNSPVEIKEINGLVK